MTQLNISQLFAPLPSGVTDGINPTTVPASTWLSIIQNNGNNLNLSTTAWQSGSPSWTMMLIFASILNMSDGGASIRAQGGFLDFAATGTVTYTDITQTPPVTVTVPVTPDPSDPDVNPTGALGWLDVLADSVYNTTRSVATYAQNNEYVANTTGASLGTYAAGTFHIANSSSGATYKNVSSFTFSASTGFTVSSVSYGSLVGITTSAPHGLSSGAHIYLTGVVGLTNNWAVITVTSATQFTLNNVTGAGSYTSGGKAWVPTPVQFVADSIGPAGSSAPGQITIATTSVPGGAIYNFDSFTGSPYQSNVSLAAQCRSALQAASPNGAKGAYEVYALSAPTFLAAQVPPKSLTANVTRVTVTTNPATGTVTVLIANANGAVPGASNVQVVGATNATPIVVHADATNMTTGMTAVINGVLGNTAANGTWIITVIDGSHFSLNGSVGNGAYTIGGVVEAGDVGLVDSVIQAYADPNTVTAQTQSAQGLNVSVAAIVYVPVAKLSDYGTDPASNKGATALDVLFSKLAIGGTVIPGAASGVVDISEVLDTIFDAGADASGKYTVSVQNVLLNGLPQSVALSTTQVAQLSSVSLTVIGV